jgi:polyhydroxyalkanoate synthesis regulator phasin
MAKEAASDIVALSGIEGKAKQKKVQKKVAQIADELMEAAENNRRHLVALIRHEVEEAVAKAEARTTAELADAKETIDRMQRQLDELRAAVTSGVASAAGKATDAASTVLRGATDAAPADEALQLMADAGSRAGEVAASSPAPSVAKRAASTAKKTTASKSTATKSTSAASAAKKSTAKKGAATKSTAAKSTSAAGAAKKTPAAKAPAKRAPAKKTTAKKTTAKKTTAKKAAPGAGSST